jgi:LCP family protein required for cell wall assembly
VQPRPAIPAYNADFPQSRPDRKAAARVNKVQQHVSREPAGRNGYRGRAQEPQGRSTSKKPQNQAKAPNAPAPKGGCGCGCLPMLVIIALAVAGLYFWLFQMPQSDVSIGQRKSDSATILICGADIGAGRDESGGIRTDTMMLLYLSGSENKVSLVSLPRDTYTITSRGVGAKLNSAYGRNGTGAEGMEGLMDYVQDIIGYRPDGYILLDMTLVTQMVELMGGVDVDVPKAISQDGLDLEAGMQHLNGQQVLALLRHRKSYAMADLTRIEVQRVVVQACMEQWVCLDKVMQLPEALSLVENHTISSLSKRNYLWIGKTLLTNLGNGLTTQTLPGYADYIGGASYYILNRDAVAEMVNTSLNPYQVVIAPGDLNIAG